MVDVSLATISSLCQAAGLPALDMSKHFIAVVLPHGHIKRLAQSSDAYFS
jgi:hypothetical protein